MRLRSIANVAAAALAVTMLTPLGGTAQDTVTVSNGEWAPFLSEHLPYGGVATRIVTAAFAAAGVDVEYRWYGDSWERAKRDAEHGQVDFSAVWYRNEDRARKFLFTDSVIDVAIVFFYHKDSPFDWDDFDTIAPDEVIGVTRGYSYTAEFDAAKQAGMFTHEVADRDILNFRKLLRRRIDAFVIGELVGHDILMQNFSPAEVATLSVHPKKISGAPMYVIMSKNHPRAQTLLARFNEGLRLLRDSGEYDAILSNYR